jgi:hypothetical protein
MRQRRWYDSRSSVNNPLLDVPNILEETVSIRELTVFSVGPRLRSLWSRQSMMRRSMCYSYCEIVINPLPEYT